MSLQICLHCGMQFDHHARRCPKCDNHLDEQTDGSTVTVDIAHNGERVHEAIEKMHYRIRDAKRGVSQYVRLIVGSGMIREQAIHALGDLQHRKVILQSDMEPGNPGAILVKLKP